MKKLNALFIYSGLLVGMVSAAEIEPTWESMAENYEVPEWFQDGKIGVWMHWGIPSATDENRPHDGSHYGRRMYGVEGYDGRTEPDIRTTAKLTEWHTQRYGHPSEFGYEDLIPSFKAEKWNPDGLVKFFKECGAHFIMPVATHHDNFDMYDSSFPWNSVDMGPKRDTIQEWKDAARRHGLKFGVSTHLYWSPLFFRTARKYQKPGTPEWLLFNMDYDPEGFSRQDSWNEHWYQRCWELIEKYDPDMFNNDSPYPDEKRGKSLGVKLFSSYLNRDLRENDGNQTTVLSFKNPNMNKAAFTYNLERGMFGQMQEHPWMWATDLSGSWFYRKGAYTRMSIPVLIGNAVDAISKNAVVMMNVALRGDGTLPERQVKYLEAVGGWIEINGEGIYGTRPWKVFGEGPLVIETKRSGENLKAYSSADIRFTTQEDHLYAFVMARPTEDIVIKTLRTDGLYDNKIGKITMLGSSETLQWERSPNGLTIRLPETLPDQPVIGFRISGVSSQQNRCATPTGDDLAKPRFSWDTVPVYIHFGKSSAPLSDSELRFVARVSDFVCLEKGHGRGRFTSTERGTAFDAKRLKALNPRMKVLFYWNTFLNYPLYDACETVSNHPQWIFRDKKGDPIYKERTLEQFNLLNPEFRRWWATTAGKAVTEYGCDGIFMDAVNQAKRPIWMKRGWGEGNEHILTQAVVDMIRLARHEMGENSLLVYNGIRSLDAAGITSGTEYLPHASGVMIEHFTAFRSRSKESIAADIDAITSAAGMGKTVVVKGWPDPTFNWTNKEKMRVPSNVLADEARKKIVFSLACFLVAAQDNSYFSYSWGWRESDGSLIDYPEFRRPLGKPKGPAVRKEWTYTRSFQHAFVWVNLAERRGKIEWK